MVDVKNLLHGGDLHDFLVDQAQFEGFGFAHGVREITDVFLNHHSAVVDEINQLVNVVGIHLVHILVNGLGAADGQQVLHVGLLAELIDGFEFFGAHDAAGGENGQNHHDNRQ